MTIKQLPAPTATIDQEWDKVRAKLQEVSLPEGAETPWFVQAGLARLRPVLVTVLATVGGLIPLFLTGGAFCSTSEMELVGPS